MNEIFAAHQWVGMMAAVGLLAGWASAWLVEKLPQMLAVSWADQAGQHVPIVYSSACTGIGLRPDSGMPNNGLIPTEHKRAGSRWPIVLAMMAIFVLCGWRYGPEASSILAAVFCGVLMTLAFIDARTYLLPDILTLPLMWLGLLISTFDIWTSCGAAVWGAAAGYLLLWLVHHGFRLVTGRDGMGYGDFKLLAALGAWLGIQAIPTVVLAASLLGITIALTMRLTGRAQAGQALPFGPALALAGIAALLWPAGWPLPWG